MAFIYTVLSKKVKGKVMVVSDKILVKNEWGRKPGSLGDMTRVYAGYDQKYSFVTARYRFVCKRPLSLADSAIASPETEDSR